MTGDELREFRNKFLNVSQAEFAAMLGVAKAVVNQLEASKEKFIFDDCVAHTPKLRQAVNGIQLLQGLFEDAKHNQNPEAAQVLNSLYEKAGSKFRFAPGIGPFLLGASAAISGLALTWAFNSLGKRKSDGR